MDPALASRLKAFVDPDRLRILGRLADGPATSLDLAGELDLPPATVARHVRRLVEAGLVGAGAGRSGLLTLRLDALHDLGRVLDRLETGTGPSGTPAGGASPEAAKVLRSFVADGRLVAIPAQGRKRSIVLDWVVERCFGEDRPYPEPEVNARLAEVHPDTAALRRYLVDGGWMTRSAGIYRRAGAPAAARSDGG